MLQILAEDFRIIFDRDPAARNWLEVLVCYPGLQALALHRFAHLLYKSRIPFIPRLISHLARFLTGIEIHPGAAIGRGVFIDHGMGVVIGETAIVGNYALIYQGVTLGGTGKESGKRHPTVGENVVVGAGAKVLGNIEIGDNVRIGAGSVVLRDVPSDCTVVGVPGRIVYRSGERVDPLEHGRLPDSEAQVIRALVDRIELLEQQIAELQPPSQPVPANLYQLVGQQVRDHAHANGNTNGSSFLIQPEEMRVDESDSHLEGNHSEKASCRLSDKVIEEFLNGSGI
ncbi:serine O-acetyltransferase [Leptolyngbya sp. AN02str]|uniref:serine O-acetyltransferase n=1 Tax=Leptolyngbya sp. AN02str TaxID=3423363 RepID=UPI003D314AAB